MLALSIIFFIIALIVAAFFAMSETAILSMNRFKLEHLESTGNRTAGRLKQLRMKPDRFLATVLVGNTFVNAAAASLATFVFGLAIGTTEEAIVLATVTVTLFLLVFSDYIRISF